MYIFKVLKKTTIPTKKEPTICNKREPEPGSM